MLDNLLFLNPLLFVINDSLIYKTAQCFATKTDSNLPFCNRVGNRGTISSDDINQINETFNTFPFRWFVESTDGHSISLLEHHGFEYKIAFPAMKLDLNVIKPIDLRNIEVMEINQKSDLKIWVELIAQVYTIKLNDFSQFIDYQITNCTSGVLKFYLADYEGIPAAASMTIRDKNITALHWVGTVPHYRKKDLGYAVSLKPLLDAQKDNCSHAVLFASEMGMPVYERIGFKTYSIYNVYGR